MRIRTIKHHRDDNSGLEEGIISELNKVQLIGSSDRQEHRDNQDLGRQVAAEQRAQIYDTSIPRCDFFIVT